MDRVTLVKAAARRARVRTKQGQEGVLVYAPGTRVSVARADQPRHGDRTKCGVRLDGHDADNIFAVDPDDIMEILDAREDA